MEKRFAAWITAIALLPWFLLTSIKCATTKKQPTLDDGTVKMLSNILESLDAFRNDRLRDLEQIRLSAPAGNGTTVTRTDKEVLSAPQNSSVSEHIKALKEGIMGHNPVKKTFGYKVTVYTSPIGDNGKDGKPVLVTQYVGGDMAPDTDPLTKRSGEEEDLQESANHPDNQMVHSSESAHLPVHVSITDAAGGGEGHEAVAADGATDHNRKTEHSASSDKGHQQSHSLHSKVAKGHDHEKHSSKKDEHHKETEKESHRHDTQAHDKGGASQQGIRERTEIEYYEREHFLDTEYDKAKTGHDKTSGVKEHESHNDHDSHENKQVHAKDDRNSHKTNSEVSLGTATADELAKAADAHVRPSHYSPPYGVHYQEEPHLVHEGHKAKVAEGSHALKEDSESSRLHHSEESKGHREHNSERDLHSEQKDKGYLDKDKGRRKEGYRERGYKITAEREYFLNDAHHDKGHATHTSGSRLKDEEGAAHASKEGERDRGFTKEEKIEEAHDAAYDSKDRKYFDGEQHKEDFSSKKTASSSGGEKKQQEEIVPLAPPGVNYVEPHHLPLPLYPPPIAYSPSDDGAKAVVVYPPDDLTPKRKHSPEPETPAFHPIRNGRTPEKPIRKHQPIGGYDDDEEDLENAGYVGHASYRKKAPSPLIASIKDSIRKDVHKKPPTYSKTEAKSSEENSVNSPEKEDEHGYDEGSYSEEGSEEANYPDDDEKPYVKYQRDHRNPSGNHAYTKSNNVRDPELLNIHPERPHTNQKDVLFPDEPKRNNQPQDDRNPYPQIREPPRYSQQSGYSRGTQDPVKHLSSPDRNAYSQIQNEKLPTVSEILDEVSRFPQGQVRPSYADSTQRNRKENNNNQIIFPELQRYYDLAPDPSYGRRQKNDYSRSQQQQPRVIIPPQRQVPTRQNQQQQQQQQQQLERLNALLQIPQPQKLVGGQASSDQLQQQLPRTSSPLEQIQQLQQQLPRTSSPIEQLQQLQPQLPRTSSPLEQLHQLHPQQIPARPASALEQIHQQQKQLSRGLTPLERLQRQQKQQHSRGGTSLEQLQQQQTQPPFSPVVLLSRGPPTHGQNQAVDVWYTRQHK